MNTIYDILSHFRATSFTEKEKGTQFERLMRAWLKTDARYAHLFEHVWLWEEFPSRKDFGGQDTGIDLVAKTHEGDYWAIQCKCYAEDTVIDKAAVDSFLATSSRTFTNEVTLQTTSFAHRLWIATTSHWGSNAEEAIQNQLPPVSRVNLYDLDHSAVDWSKIFEGLEGKAALSEKKQLREHQREALKAAHQHFLSHDRGKLIMACGTGKTFTSLKLIEQELKGKGLVLFLVPSIALLGQSLNDWMGDAETPIKAVCICSDSRASRKIKRGNANDELETSIVDLALPASTNTTSITHQLLSCRAHDGLTVVFSTYQSIDVVAEAQAELLAQTSGKFGVFDFVVCDEAHRTTGVKLSTKDESNFIKIHNDDFIRGQKRLYMTATPRLYGENARIKASKNNCVLCSMDDETLYGQEFYRVNFSYAVQNGILTDYKVLVLTVSEDMIPADLMKQVKDLNAKELNYDDTGRLIGVINGLSKKILGDKGVTWDADPRLMRRALAFTHKIGREDEPGTSRNIEHVLPRVSALYNETLSDEERKNVVHIKARHVDGSMGATERNAALAWLAEEADDPQECRVVTNVRCLSEGVDVPALDAVLFLSARNSQVDVVQSVGRVMRSFRRGQPDEKKYGYIIIPVIVPEGTTPEEALNDNKTFSVVWDILNALRSHDDHFNAHVNTIALNRDKGAKVTVGLPGLGRTGVGGSTLAGDPNDSHDAQEISNQEVAHQLTLQFGATQQNIFAKLVEKCGDRLYWENWAAEVGEIAKKYIARIARLVTGEGGKYSAEFDEFVRTLRHNLNPGITAEQCIEMLAQHLITRPVFEALFADYQFVSNNSISSSMQLMIDLLESEAVDKDLTVLSNFYESVRANVGKIDNLEGKQTVIKNLYEKFFKRAFPLTVEKLGTVYTPVECVDFILHSVDEVLQSEFGAALTQENVHVLDPFTARALSSRAFCSRGSSDPKTWCANTGTRFTPTNSCCWPTTLRMSTSRASFKRCVRSRNICPMMASVSPTPSNWGKTAMGTTSSNISSAKTPKRWKRSAARPSASSLAIRPIPLVRSRPTTMRKTKVIPSSTNALPIPTWQGLLLDCPKVSTTATSRLIAGQPTAFRPKMEVSLLSSPMGLGLMATVTTASALLSKRNSIKSMSLICVAMHVLLANFAKEKAMVSLEWAVARPLPSPYWCAIPKTGVQTNAKFSITTLATTSVAKRSSAKSRKPNPIAV